MKPYVPKPDEESVTMIVGDPDEDEDEISEDEMNGDLDKEHQVQDHESN